MSEVTGRSPSPEQAWRCPHAPECEERFDTLDALNEHVDNTRHACCQMTTPARGVT
jgi:hypothetical protein